MSRAWHDQPPLLHELVRAEARRAPDRMAFVFDNHWMTYGELAARSARWAAHLRRQGVGVGTLVAIHLERSLELPVIVLAVLEAGGVCVPLEPSDPPQRLEAVLREAAPALVITQRHLREHLPASSLPALFADEEPPPAPAWCTPMAPEGLAFVLMTSGSTGVPKGVMISHAAAAARMFRPEEDLPPAGTCMAIMKTPTSNSPFLGEMFAPLLHGCYAVIARPDGHQDIPYLGRLMIDFGVSHIAMPSAVLRAFLEWPEASRCRSLMAVYTGGEAVSDELRESFLTKYPQARFVATYGTTEAGHKLSCECPREQRLAGTRLGRAIARAEVQMLDGELQRTTPGEVGEMFLGGPRLATGYLHRPAWTAERFRPHPSPSQPGDRLYRSGDLARQRADGEFEFHGRGDHLVKVRGNRVEPQEVEALLSQHAGVREAVVLARPNGAGDCDLIAFFVPRGAPAPTSQDLRDHLCARLPFYMVPRLFVAMGDIPLTHSGKLDRRALAGFELDEHAHPGDEYLPPRTHIEQALADIWQGLLGVERVGLADNFFSLGGHSILAAKVCAEIESRLQRRLSLSVLFGAPSLQALAEAVSGHPPLQRAVAVVPVRPVGNGPPLLLMPTMSGSPWMSRNLLECLDPTRPVFALGLADDHAPWGERATLAEIAHHCVTALREAHLDGPLHIVGHSFGGVLAYEVARQLRESGVAVEQVAIIDAWLEQGRDRSGRARLKNLGYFAINLPRWVFHFAFKRSPTRQVFAVRGRARAWMRRVRTALGRRPELKQIDWQMDRRNTPDTLRKRIDVYFRALQTYQPGPYAGRVVLFRAQVRPLLHGLSPDLNWGQFVTGTMRVIPIPGDHGTILKKPNNVRLAALLEDVLDRG